MNKCIFTVSIILTALLISATSFAGIDNTVGARGEGIGFGYSAIANDPFGALYNPASAAYGKMWQTQFQYIRPTRYGFTLPSESPYLGLAGVGYHKEGIGNVALNILQLGSTSSPTTVTTTTNVTLTYARLLGNGLAVGTNAKYLFETNFGERKAYDFDLGVSYRPNANFALAASGENLLKSKLTPDYRTTTEHLARKARMTGAYFIPMENILGSIVGGYQMTQAGELKTQSTSLMNVGSEWWFGTTSNVTLGVRGGYTFGNATLSEINEDYGRIHVGMSVNYNLAGRDLRFDYGLRTYPFESSENTAADHSFSITYGFGGVPEYGKKHEARNVTQSYKSQQTRAITPPPAAKPKVEMVQRPTPPQLQPPAITETKPVPAVKQQIVETPKPVINQPMVETSPSQPPAIAIAKPVPEVNQLVTETPKPVINQPLVETPIKLSPITEQQIADATPIVVTPPPAPIAIEQPLKPTPTSHQLAESTRLPSEQVEQKASPIVHGQGESTARPANPPAAKPAPLLAQNTEELAPIESQPIPAITPVQQQPVTAADYMKLELGLDVSDISIAGETRIVFYLRPVRVVKLTTWKLYIFKARLKDWDEQKAEAFAVHTITGKGIPPINVIWNGLLAEGRMVPSGKYYFIMAGQDKFGQRFISDWCKFAIK